MFVWYVSGHVKSRTAPYMVEKFYITEVLVWLLLMHIGNILLDMDCLQAWNVLSTRSYYISNFGIIVQDYLQL